MEYWILPANSKKYDYVSAFEKQEFIDWTKNYKYEIIVKVILKIHSR